jgi:hypothetical protein
MRAMGVMGAGIAVVAALLVSSASTKTAEAHSSRAESVTPVATPAAAADTALAPAPSPPAPVITRAPFVERVTPPPADLNLENPKLRRLHKSEITPAMLDNAARIVRKHHAKPVGTEVELEVEGKRIVARIERHFHPEGGSVKPWGFHPGVSLFVAR